MALSRSCYIFWTLKIKKIQRVAATSQIFHAEFCVMPEYNIMDLWCPGTSVELPWWMHADSWSLGKDFGLGPVGSFVKYSCRLTRSLIIFCKVNLCLVYVFVKYRSCYMDFYDAVLENSRRLRGTLALPVRLPKCNLTKRKTKGNLSSVALRNWSIYKEKL